MKGIVLGIALAVGLVGVANAAESTGEYLAMGTRALKIGNWQGAVYLTKMAMSGDLSQQGRVVALNNLCIGLTNLRDPEALAMCNESVASSNGHWGSLVNRSNLYRQLGKDDMADADLAQAKPAMDDVTLRRVTKQPLDRDQVAYVAMMLR